MSIALLGACAFAGWRMLRCMSVLWDRLPRSVDDEHIGPRLQARYTRRAMRATGIWLLTISANIAWIGIGNGSSTSFIAPFLMGMGMTLWPGIFPAASTVLLPAHDYAEPIGPEPDPMPHVRSPEALERWLTEEEDLDDNFAAPCLEGVHDYALGSRKCVFCGGEDE